MTDLRSLALTTLFPGFVGTTVPPSWVGRLAADGLGGVVLYGRNIDPDLGDDGVAELTSSLRAAGLLVAIDEEGGDVTRLDAAVGSSLPGNAALGALDDPALTEEVAAELGGRLRRCGIDLNFAPVADVDTNAENPVIGARSFGADPELVSRHVAAFVTGQQRHGVAATAKHFPGHGGTSEDSHLTVPVLDEPLDVIRRVELPPFRAGIKTDTKVVMTAHVRVPALDSDELGTLSRPVVTGLLRDTLGFDGVVMTDGLDMRAISGTVGHAEAAVLAVRAGVDALCVGGDTTGPELVETMADALVDAVRSGRLSETRLAAAARRVRALRAWSRGQFPVSDGAVAEATARATHRAVRAIGDVRLTGPPLVLELQDPPSIAAGEVPWGIGMPLAARLPGTTVIRLDEDGPPVTEVLATHSGRRVVVSMRGIHRYPWQGDVVTRARRERPDLIVVEHDVGSPREVLGPHHVLAFGASRATAEAAAEELWPR
ncbi:glycoside hydrolase family 3 protein [Haloechinothrix salitolerans]|uniref:Glycoside hydrolase family 3 protein n=1 Tax=Haloechinothrix salitolerans TaxID=926830 RepID=A0ABW2C0Y1_9PSEU